METVERELQWGSGGTGSQPGLHGEFKGSTSLDGEVEHLYFH